MRIGVAEAMMEEGALIEVGRNVARAVGIGARRIEGIKRCLSICEAISRCSEDVGGRYGWTILRSTARLAR